tara:strand:- start:2258 stop:3361 length:1104 start_codon:yes stop_codon:yes gene_type:complete
MRLKSYIKKVLYIVKEEGPKVLISRIARYIVYSLNRKFGNFQEDIAKWESLKNQYEGKRAFIIGNGPSLNKLPLHLLQNEYTICFNRFDLMLERLSWTPFAYSVIDDLVLTDVPEIANKMAAKVDHAFFPDLHPSAPIGRNFKKLIKPRKNIYWLHLGDIGYSDDLPNCGINKTVANVAVQILAYMGFSEVYFIGVDLDYKVTNSTIKENSRDLKGGEDDDPNHFDPRYFGKGRKFHHPRMDETFEKFDEAAEFLKRKGVKGYNAGIGGKLDSFERVDFRSLFNFSNEEELKMLIGHIKPEISSDSLNDLFPEALFIKEVDEWNDSYNEIICPFSIGSKLIPKKVLTYTPYGPYDGQYVFLSKNTYS